MLRTKEESSFIIAAMNVFSSKWKFSNNCILCSYKQRKGLPASYNCILYN